MWGGLDGMRAKVKAQSMYRGLMCSYPYTRSEECVADLAALSRQSVPAGVRRGGWDGGVDMPKLIRYKK